MDNGTLIIISGHAATGKSTLGKKISEHFSIPLVSPDGIKEIMWDNMGWEQDAKGWDEIGGASFELAYYFMDASLSKGKSLIVEAHFEPGRNNDRLNEYKKKYNCNILQIHCKADREVIVERFKERIKSENYHEGHKHGIRRVYSEEEFFSKVGKGEKLLSIDGETCEIDTTNTEKVDHAKLFKFIADNL